MVLDSCMMQLRHLRAGNKLVCTSYFLPLEHRSRGPTDKASDYESEDCGFESHRDHFPSRYQLINFSTSVFKKNTPLRVGFEPTREDPIWFLVKRLNHSAIAALYSGGSLKSNFVWHEQLLFDLVTGQKVTFKLRIWYAGYKVLMVPWWWKIFWAALFDG